MKKWLLMLLVLFVVGAGFTQGLGTEQRQFLLNRIDSNSTNFILYLDKITDEELHKKPSPDKWSIAETAEHLILGIDFINNFSKQVLQKPAQDFLMDSVIGKDILIMEKMKDRSKKGVAPEPIVPTGKWKTKKEFAEAFKKRTNELIEYVKTTVDPLNNHFGKMPAFGHMSAYHWLVFGVAHVNRHLLQIQEIIQTIRK